LSDLPNLGAYIAEYIFDIYSEDKEMLSALKRMFEEHRYMCFSKLTDKSIISTLIQLRVALQKTDIASTSLLAMGFCIPKILTAR